MEERVVRKLMASVKCNQCGQPYRLENVQVLGRHQDMWFFNVYCAHCHNQYFIAATVNADQTTTITDLTPADVTRLQKANPLTSDDVLDMHSYLKNYQGDITRLFNTNAFNI
ncbi:MAG: hypothetical protein PHE50_07720 [Dehalococcoidales bacterium]|nr:hypothetical protein [Dehalococcoidales bacterium]